MGIRFLCPNGHKLNVKSELAGKRASCPECGAKLMIPAADTNGDSVSVAAAPTGVTPAATVASGAAASVVAASVAATGWYLRTPAGEQFGPATTDEFRSLIIAGRVAGDTPIWRDGWPAWKHAREVPDELPAPLAAVPAFAAVVPVAPKIDIPPIPEPSPAAPVIASPVVVDPSLAAVSVAVSAPQTVTDDTTLQPTAIASDRSDTTSASYIAQRRRAKRKQATLAILMLIAVLVLGVVLVWVLRSNLGGEGESPTTTSQVSIPQESERT
jgi:hypothetical protein